MIASIQPDLYRKALKNIGRILGNTTLSMFFAGGAVLGLLTILGYLGSLNWLLDLFSQFRVQYIFYFLFCMLLSLDKRNRKFLVAWILLLLLNVPDLISLYLPQEAPKTAVDSRLRVLDMNLLYCNHDHEGAYRTIEQYKPDVITFQELTPAWYAYLDKNLKEYPHHKYWLHDTPFGIGIFSRLPMEQAEIRFPSTEAPPLAHVQVKVNGSIVHVLSVHTLPPTRDWMAKTDLKLSQSIGSLCTSLKGPVVMAGDLNATSSSHTFKSMLSACGLKDSQRGFGWQPSWMTLLPVFMRLSIDHCFVSQNVVVLRRELGPIFSSDHQPLYLELGLPGSDKDLIGSAQLAPR